MIPTDVDSGLPANGAFWEVQCGWRLCRECVGNGIRSQMAPELDQGAESLAQLRTHLGEEPIGIVSRAQDCH